MTKKLLLDAATKPTKENYDGFQSAYGYFSGDRFAHEDGTPTDKISLNPAHFRDRPVTDVLATFTHKMVHLWQASRTGVAITIKSVLRR